MMKCQYCSVLQGQPHAGYCLTRMEGDAERWVPAEEVKIDIVAGMRMGASQLGELVKRNRARLSDDDFETLNAIYRLLVKGSAQIEREQQ